MTVSNLAITLREKNDETVFLTITKNGVAYNLTGAEIEFIFKDTTATADAQGTTLSVTNGDVTITDAALGLAEVTLTSAHTATPVTGWVCRVDVIIAGKRKTAGYGAFNVTNL